jgi:hypothetical protein
MDIILNKEEKLTVSVKGEQYVIEGNGRISSNGIALKLKDLFDESKHAQAEPAVDYSKIFVPQFIYQNTTVDGLLKRGIKTLADFIEENQKIIRESCGVKDIFYGLKIEDSSYREFKMSEVPSCKGIDNYHFLYCIANIYKLTNGEFPVAISFNRDRYYIDSLSDSSKNIISKAGLTYEIINKRYYKFYSK